MMRKLTRVVALLVAVFVAYEAAFYLTCLIKGQNRDRFYIGNSEVAHGYSISLPKITSEVGVYFFMPAIRLDRFATKVAVGPTDHVCRLFRAAQNELRDDKGLDVTNLQFKAFEIAETGEIVKLYALDLDKNNIAYLKVWNQDGIKKLRSRAN